MQDTNVDDNQYYVQDESIKAYELLNKIAITSHIEKVIGVIVNGELKDLFVILKKGDTVEFVVDGDNRAIDLLRHSTSHLMAQAIKNIYPSSKLAIGPSIENGFYYDIDMAETLTEESLHIIEEEMKQLTKKNYPIIRKILSISEAKNFFKEKGENYKLELLENIKDDTVSIYEQGDFVDLCAGPHIPSTGRIKHFKLISLAGAYWRGDSKNKMLQRIYGTAFFSKSDLEDYLKNVEEAKNRDHRKLGRQLNLFIIEESLGAGFPIYLPKGGILRSTLEEFEKKQHLNRGYNIVYGPILLKKELWAKSGHLENYKENMYFTKVDDTEYGIKPMNCLSHIMTYKSDIRSYRDLPLRYFELGTVHRHEKSGVLHGLLRARAFTQDDAHIFCTREQLIEEIHFILDFVKDVMNIFGFDYEVAVSTKPLEKFIGSDEIWNMATKALISALDEKKYKYKVKDGEGAFYGPKIDIELTDALGRKWQCATIQCDFNLPERFDLNFIGSDGLNHRPVMLHRVILGSIDRFIGILIEHFAGAFPFWLSPTQIIIINITDAQAEYAREIYKKLLLKGFRVNINLDREKINYKIRQAAAQKIPHIVIVGDKEMKSSKISLRLKGEEQKNDLDFSEYLDVISKLNDSKTMKLWG
jgi:threonyl-tRNA synthetase